LELSSTATGGGVAELLASLVPLEADLGLRAEWRVITADAGFFAVTKRIHNGMQGTAGGIPVQLEDGVCGYLASTPADVAARVVALLEDPATARRLGAAGHEQVRERFLLPRLLRNQLRLLVLLTGA
jgi:trehalose synthase